MATFTQTTQVITNLLPQNVAQNRAEHLILEKPDNRSSPEALMRARRKNKKELTSDALSDESLLAGRDRFLKIIEV